MTLCVCVKEREREKGFSAGCTYIGGGYRPFRAVKDSLHVFVDHYEPTSNQGVVKV